MNWLDWLTLISYIALNVEICMQAWHIYRTKSSHDLSIPGMVIRFMAIAIILVKFATIGDLPILIGQAVIVLTFGTYFALAIHYRWHNKRRRS